MNAFKKEQGKKKNMKSFLLSQLQVSVTGIFMDADRSYALLKESLCLYPVRKYSDDLYNLMHPNCPVFFLKIPTISSKDCAFVSSFSQ